MTACLAANPKRRRKVTNLACVKSGTRKQDAFIDKDSLFLSLRFCDFLRVQAIESISIIRAKSTASIYNPIILIDFGFSKRFELSLVESSLDVQFILTLRANIL